MTLRPALLLPVLLALAACSRPAPTGLIAEAPGVRAVLSTNTLHVGDRVHLRLAVQHPAGTRVEAPELQRGREIVVRDLQQPADLQSATCTVFDLQLTSLVVSNHVLDGPGLRLVGPDGHVSTTAFPFVTLNVESMLAGTNAAFRSAKGLAAWPDRQRQRALLIGGLVLLLAGLLLAWWLIRRHRARPPAPAAPPTPAHVLALAALQALRERQLIEQGLVEPFYVELSTIVRTYLERRFGLHAPEQTTDEFIREAIRSCLLSLDHQHLVAVFLEQSDLVKFARHQPEAADMQNAAAAAERLVTETTPPPSPGASAP